MDCEVPAYLGLPGVGRGDDDLRALDDYFFFSQEPLELLLCGDGGGAGGGASGVQETPSLTNLPDSPPPLPTYYTAGNPSGKSAPPSEAEMASWLCQVFEQEPRRAATTSAMATRSEGVNVVVPSSGGGARGDLAASGAAESQRGPSSSGRRRSSSGKAAEQRRRNKISDKLRTLHQMLPWCSKVKTDKASTLEEVIKYVKSLQHQVQVMAANGYAIPTPIWPLAGMPPPCMQQPKGDVLGAPAPVMFPRCPVLPTVYAFRHHDTALPLTAPPCTSRHPVEPGSGGGRQDLTMPTHR